MTNLFRRILELVEREEVLVSDHGYDELAADGILVTDVYAGVRHRAVVEEYPDYHKGPCVLVLQRDRDGEPIRDSRRPRQSLLLPIGPIQTGGAAIS